MCAAAFAEIFYVVNKDMRIFSSIVTLPSLMKEFLGLIYWGKVSGEKK